MEEGDFFVIVRNTPCEKRIMRPEKDRDSSGGLLTLDESWIRKAITLSGANSSLPSNDGFNISGIRHLDFDGKRIARWICL